MLNVMYTYDVSSMSDNVKYLLKQLLTYGKCYDVTCLFIDSHINSQLSDSPIGSDILTAFPTLSWLKKVKYFLFVLILNVSQKHFLLTIKKVSF